MKLTRRKLAAALVSATAAAAQQPQPAATCQQTIWSRLPAIACRPMPPRSPATPLPMATEPAFQFKA